MDSDDKKREINDLDIDEEKGVMKVRYLPVEKIDISESETVIVDNFEETKEPKSKTLKEQTATTIALLFVVGFLTLLGIPLLFLGFKLIEVQDVLDVTTNYSAILGGMIGSVVGYYFSSIEKK